MFDLGQYEILEDEYSFRKSRTHMKFFHRTRTRRTRRTRRNIAAAVLLVWLFGLASGIANACMLENVERHLDSPPAAHSSAMKDASDTVAGPGAGATGSHEDQPDVPNEACLQVCDDSSRALVDQNSAFHLPDSGLARFVDLIWVTTDSGVLLSSLANTLHPPASGPPVRIRFSRLIL